MERRKFLANKDCDSTTGATQHTQDNEIDVVAFPAFEISEHQRNMAYIKDIIQNLDIPADVLMFTTMMCNGSVEDALHWLLEGTTKSGAPMWTPEDDSALLNNDRKKSEQLEAKYGLDAVQLRMQYLAQNLQ